MNKAISDPALQAMELHHVSKHIMRGHVVLHFYSTAVAERMHKASSVEFGSEGDTMIVITPLAPAGAIAIPPNETWRYAVVSTKLPSYEYCKPDCLRVACNTRSWAIWWIPSHTAMPRWAAKGSRLAGRTGNLGRLGRTGNSGGGPGRAAFP